MEVSLLQYADDTLILIDGHRIGLLNLKLMIRCFEFALGLSVNWEKSSKMGIGYLLPECDGMALC